MAANDCITAIRKAADTDLSDDELEVIIEELQRRAASRRADAGLQSLDEVMLNTADELAREVVEAAKIEQRNRLINIRVFNDAIRFASAVDAATGDPSQAIEAMLVGVNRRFEGSRKSVDARGNAIHAEVVGGLLHDLKKDNLLPLLNSGELDRDIARGLESLTKPGTRLPDSDDAIRIAKVIDKYRKVLVARENRAGAWIKPLPGYVTRQSHDMARVRRAGFEAWRDSILPLLDQERTFQGADPDKFLRGAWEGITTGRHLKQIGGEENDLAFAFKGPGNLAKRISQQRVLHFKDADSWFDYNQSFGSRSLIESVLGEMERGSRNIALMERLGTNPRAMFDKIMDALKDQHRGDEQKFKRLGRQSLGWFMDEVDGTTRMPVNASVALVGSIVRSIESMAKLGGAVLSATADLPFKAVELTRQGRNILQAYGDTLATLVDGIDGDAGKRATADLIGVGLEGQIGDVASRFNAQDNVVGNMAKWQQRFFKFNLLTPWTDANKRGIGLMMARDLANMKDKAWDQLDGQIRDLMGFYGLDASHWEIARQAVRKAPDGREYLMPDGVRDVSDQDIQKVVGKMTDRKIRSLRDDIETALRSYIVDRTDFAVPTPGAKERAFTKFGTRPGTPMGEAIRFIMQFKSFPITVLTKPFSSAVFGQGTTNSFRQAMLNGEGGLQGMVHLMVATTVMGYVAQSAKELAKGKTPRDPKDPATWHAAMLQGGGLGIYGDFLLGETNRFGRSMLDTLAGPTIGSIADLDEIRARTMAGEDVGAQVLRAVKDNTPFLNLFYTRTAIDYLFLYQLQEAMNPGYLRRMERRIKKEQGQEFLLPPSRSIPRGGGNRLLESVR